MAEIVTTPQPKITLAEREKLYGSALANATLSVEADSLVKVTLDKGLPRRNKIEVTTDSAEAIAFILDNVGSDLNEGVDKVKFMDVK